MTYKELKQLIKEDLLRINTGGGDFVGGQMFNNKCLV